jgi:hypothetical protein
VNKSKKAVPDSVVDEWIDKRASGLNWFQISLSYGVPRNYSAKVPLAVYRRLVETNRHHFIKEFWPRGVPLWLSRCITKKPPHTHSRLTKHFERLC